MVDNVNHPDHYQGDGIECIDAIRAMSTPEEFQGHCRANVIKYLWRWKSKGGVESLKKARVYLDWMIESAENDSPATP